MKFPIRWMILLVSSLSLLIAAAAEDPTHEELRTLRKEIIEAVGKGDIDTIIQHTRPDVVVTWQNSVVCRGHQQLKDFFAEVGKKSFKGYKVPPTPDSLTILHGDNTGISFGETVGRLHLLGKDYDAKSRWTATLIKENGRWQLAAYHISMNALDNPILDTAKRALYIASVIALAVGILTGVIVSKLKKPSHPPLA